jgi:hypothetical protein
MSQHHRIGSPWFNLTAGIVKCAGTIYQGGVRTKTLRVHSQPDRKRKSLGHLPSPPASTTSPRSPGPRPPPPPPPLGPLLHHRPSASSSNAASLTPQICRRLAILDQLISRRAAFTEIRLGIHRSLGWGVWQPRMKLSRHRTHLPFCTAGDLRPWACITGSYMNIVWYVTFTGYAFGISGHNFLSCSYILNF